ncbi:homing endonuclease protein [Rhizobium phage RHph_TM40]|uniref:Putative Seg-like homing endonuclease protein n=1 Tax=Rhizobium phage RHph_TM30 TaxID=2509764 RepID=A0A7S5REQ9_9CAUD|nr:HNH endonuclease [Rhizobium phage RHph_TM30]QIG71254.1 putative Seg-like homing endonuclease protein [Rhizobium phage RHph_TM30]QIG71617.1 homing endonuclease protein [Rhizobium phage RHph_TM40]QIG71980.1 homing endonuclease protein [Rhizobium phage RHph_TM2_3B]QIG72342.1 homing endonuclease protein [Rhizobium phage RHph_TM3_3_6]
MLNQEIEYIIHRDADDKRYADRYIKFINNYMHPSQESGAWHHVLPRSLYSEHAENPNNIVRLSHRAHFISHRMLLKVFNTRQMFNALHLMIHGHRGDYRVLSNKQYQTFMDKRSEHLSEFFREESRGGVSCIEISTGRNVRVSRETYRLNPDKYTHWFKSNNPGGDTVHLPWSHPRALESTKVIWSICDEIHNLWSNVFRSQKMTYYNFMLHCQKETDFIKRFEIEMHLKPVRSMIRKFESGWDPTSDEKWINFRKSRQ